MHTCRHQKLKDYQKVLEKRSKTFFLLLERIEDGKPMLAKPATKSIWHPKFSKQYLYPRFAKMLKALVVNKSKMFTLTYSTEKYTPKQCVKRHKADFKKFVREIRKTYKNFEYCYFIEVTKKMMIHFHVYTHNFIDVNDLRQAWSHVTGNYIVKIKTIRDETQKFYAAGYQSVIKKFNHEQLEFLFHNVSRLFGCSRNWWKISGITNTREQKFNRISLVFVLPEEMIAYLNRENQIKTEFWQDKELELILNHFHTADEFCITDSGVVVIKPAPEEK